MANFKIIWSQRANKKLFGILDFYANRNKSVKYSDKLYNKFIEELNLLNKHPNLGIKTDFEEIKGLIIDDFILFYEIKNASIYVHLVWDCRQDPNKLKIK
jgi:plasmid stabilization system protein ParE